MSKTRIISGDSHVFEPPDLWQTRMQKQYRERAPHVERHQDGDWWYCDGFRVAGVFGPAQLGMRFKTPEKLSTVGYLDQVRPGGWVPAEHIKDMAIDGVDEVVLYPTPGIGLYRVPDTDLLTDICRTYNDWVAEFCKVYPNQTKGIAMLNADDTEVAVLEMQRCAKLGLIGATIPIKPLPDRTYDSPVYDPLWAAAQDLNMPLTIHSATVRMLPPPPGVKAVPLPSRGSRGTNAQDSLMRDALSDIIFAKVFERFPKLQVGAVELELGWIPFFIRRMDHGYTQSGSRSGATGKFKDGMLPSDFIHRNTFFTFMEDDLGIRMRDIIGVKNLVWGNDYPHTESTWPESQRILGETLAGCSDEEKALVTGGNVARIYRLN